MFGVVVGALAIVCVCVRAISGHGWYFVWKMPKCPFIWRLTFMFCMPSFLVCFTFLCANHQFLAHRLNIPPKNRNEEADGVIEKSSIFYAVHFYGLRIDDFFPILYTFLIKNHWLFYTSEKLIFNNICSQYITLDSWPR